MTCAFQFVDRPPVDATFIGWMPRECASKANLVDSIGAALVFPDYYGRNWDALYSCLCDLDWLPPGKVALVHSDVPKVPLDVLLTYLKLLGDAIEYWRDKHRDLVVTFPSDARSEVLRYLAA
jgi:RNAse (barnase) inhibitor barstar